MNLKKSSFNKNRCGRFFANKGILQPRCGCNSCWDFFFYKNPGKVMAAYLALKELGEAAVVKAQGQLFYNAIRMELVNQMIGEKRHAIDRETIIQNRGEKFLKNLKRWLKSNPIPTDAPKQYEEMYDEVVTIAAS
jgi:hypothetical protein